MLNTFPKKDFNLVGTRSPPHEGHVAPSTFGLMIILSRLSMAMKRCEMIDVRC